MDDHDTAAEIFAAGLTVTWRELLDLPGLAIWALLGLGLLLRVGAWPVVGMAFVAVLIWC